MDGIWRPWTEDTTGPSNVTREESEDEEDEENSENEENNPPVRGKRQHRSSFSEDFQQAIIDLHKFNVDKGSPHPVKDVCDALKLHRSQVHRVLNKGVQTPGQRGRRRVSLSIADSFHEDVIRRMIYKKYSDHEIPTIRALYKEVKEEMPDFPYGVTSFYRLLKKMGFRYKKIQRQYSQSMTARVVGLRDRYLTKVDEHRKKERILVFLDETWFDTHDTKTKGLVDNSVECTMILPSNRGKRVVVLHAGTDAGFVPGCLLSAKNIQNSSADYNSDMDSDMSERRVKNRFLPSLEAAFPGKSCVIVLDDASYHSRLRIPNATMSKTKAQLQDIMAFRGIEIPQPVPTKAKLLEIINAHNPEQQYVVDEMIKAAGHEVLRLPPYGCELNPIELVWSQYKGNVRAKNTSRILSSTVVGILRQEEAQPSYNNLWKECCEHVKKIEQSEIKHLTPLNPIVFDVGGESSEEEEEDFDRDDDVPDSAIVL